jgi:hypothetical protein
MSDVYVARRRLRVGGRDVMPGDEVPEANSWYHLSTYVHNGSLALVQTDTHYARGMHQRRPEAPERADYRVKRDRWHGELEGWGKAGQPPPPSTQLTSVTPDTVSETSDGTETITLVWEGPDPTLIGFADASGPGVTATWPMTVLDPGIGTWTSYPGFWGNASGPGSYPVSLWDDTVEISNQLPFTTTA